MSSRFLRTVVAWGVALAAITSGVPAAHASSTPPVVRVVGLETDATRTPLGVDGAHPRLSWRLESARRGVRQAAYHVTVSAGSREVWDSGKVAGGTPWVDYAGPELASRTRYEWRVRVWDERGVPTAPAESWFETGFMAASEWQADWIKGTLTDCTTRDQCPAPLLRTEFEVDKPVASARLYASGMGYGTYYIGGRRVGDALMDPGFTDYMDRVFYVTHDVTDLVRRGRNALGAELGRGWFGIALGQGAINGYAKSAAWHAEPKLKLELHMTYADGTSDVVRSNASTWRTTDGPTRFDDLMLGETYDARRAAQLDGWSTGAYDDGAWQPAVATTPPSGRLAAMDQEPVRVREVLDPETVKRVADGVYVLDFAQDIAGTAVIDGDLPEGRQLTLRYGEKLNAAGRVVAIGGGQLDKYTAAAGPDRWSAQFSYKGFRYVEVTGLTEEPARSLVRAQVWASDMERVGRWTSSNGLVNQIVANSARAYLGNTHSVPTDCPHYEKGAYTGDGQLTAAAYSYLYDNQRFNAKWSVDVAQSVFPTGQMDWIAPAPRDPATSPHNNVHLLTPGWDAALFVVPGVLREYYGDERPGVRSLPQMKIYRDWIAKFGPAGFIPEAGYSVFSATGLGDWAGPTGSPTNVSLDATAWYHEITRLLELTARDAGETTTAADAAALRERIKLVFNARFWNPATGSYENRPGSSAIDGRQHANAMPVGLGLADGDRAKTAGDAIAADVRSRGDHLFTGIMGTRFLFPALTQTGNVDAAWAAATQTTYPSYGYWIKLGWTALGEYWEESARSRNHHMYGTVVQWLFEDIAGYRPTKPGFEEIEFRPHVPSQNLDWVDAATDTVRGRVATRWRKADGVFELQVTVPAGSTATVHLPASAAASISESGVPVADAEGVEEVGQEGERRVLRVGSGTYDFRVAE